MVSCGTCMPQKNQFFTLISVDKLLDWYTDSGVTCFWACSPAAEYTHLNDEECLQFTKFIVNKCQQRKLTIISGVRSQSSIDKYAEEIKVDYIRLC